MGMKGGQCNDYNVLDHSGFVFPKAVSAHRRLYPPEEELNAVM